MNTWKTLRELIATRGINGKVIVSAELGLNHNGDMALAMKMIEAAADAGCHAVKVQNYRTGDVVGSRRSEFEIDGKKWNEWDTFSRCELDRVAVATLKAHADSCGLIFHSTPTNEQGIRDLILLKVPIVKIASDLALYTDFMLYADQCSHLDFGRVLVYELIASSGCLEGRNLIESIARFPHWLWLHCVRKYPTPMHEANLSRIGELRMMLGKYKANPLIGYSDHTEGIECAVSAVKDYGAVWLECHVTLDKALAGPDHRWSKDFNEIVELVRCLK